MKEYKLNMRLIIAGCRDCKYYPFLFHALQTVRNEKGSIGLVLAFLETVVSGCAEGVDTMGEIYAKEFNLKIDAHPADWSTHGRSAGFKRNIEMADNADALLALWDGSSKGTGHMIKTATEKGLDVFVYMLPPGYQVLN